MSYEKNESDDGNAKVESSKKFKYDFNFPELLLLLILSNMSLSCIQHKYVCIAHMYTIQRYAVTESAQVLKFKHTPSSSGMQLKDTLRES